MGLRKKLNWHLQKQRRKFASATDFSFSNFVWLLDRPPTERWIATTTQGEIADDIQIIERVMAAYRAANADFKVSGSFWDTAILKLNNDIHQALMGDCVETAAMKLRAPKDNTHFWGFDSIAKAPSGTIEPHQNLLEKLDPSGDWQEQFTLWTQDKLITLANAIGAMRLHYPESPRCHAPSDIETVLDQIEEKLGATLSFPNPYAGEMGLGSSRGVISFRAIQALYQAWRICEIARGREEFKVLEIGAGLGRTCYFARMLGVSDYSIIDIPMTGAAQGYFLNRTLGQNTISLYGEPQTAPVKLVPASALHQMNEKFDLIVNVDSLTEMDGSSMLGYWDYILKSTPRFLSINHHENERTLNDLYEKTKNVRVERFPYWMRRGYLEEHVFIDQTRP